MFIGLVEYSLSFYNLLINGLKQIHCTKNKIYTLIITLFVFYYMFGHAYLFNANDRDNLLKDVIDKNKKGIKYAESLAEKILNKR